MSHFVLPDPPERLQDVIAWARKLIQTLRFTAEEHTDSSEEAKRRMLFY